MTLDELQALFASGKRCRFVFFWSHEPRRPGSLGAECFEIVVRGNLAKFGQHAPLREYLAGTRARVLAEASPTDRVWGIGLEAADPRAQDPRQWRGLNLLGFALMAVRDKLAAR